MNDTKEVAASSSFGLMKYVHLTFFAGAFTGGWLLIKIVDSIWVNLNLTFAQVPSPNFGVSFLVGGGIAVAFAFYLWRHPHVNRLVVEIVTELSKVTWPTRKELSASTVVVLVVSIIASLILGAFDAFWSWATSLIY
jgi:preprotein translocase subunit SecE